MKKKNYFDTIFMFIWGLLFGGIPLVMLIVQIAQNGIKEFKNIWWLLIFVIFGTTSVVKGLINLFKIAEDKKILKTGQNALGTFVSEKGAGEQNGVKLFHIVFEFKDEAGNIHENTTTETYTFDEAERFRKAETFKIKFKGSRAVIVPQSYLGAKISAICPYCKSKFDGEICPNCGAKKTHNF